MASIRGLSVARAVGLPCVLPCHLTRLPQWLGQPLVQVMPEDVVSFPVEGFVVGLVDDVAQGESMLGGGSPKFAATTQSALGSASVIPTVFAASWSSVNAVRP